MTKQITITGKKRVGAGMRMVDARKMPSSRPTRFQGSKPPVIRKLKAAHKVRSRGAAEGRNGLVATLRPKNTTTFQRGQTLGFLPESLKGRS